MHLNQPDLRAASQNWCFVSSGRRLDRIVARAAPKISDKICLWRSRRALTCALSARLSPTKVTKTSEASRTRHYPGASFDSQQKCLVSEQSLPLPTVTVCQNLVGGNPKSLRIVLSALYAKSGQGPKYECPQCFLRGWMSGQTDNFRRHA